MLVNDLDSSNKFAKVGIVGLRQRVEEVSESLTIQIVEELPSFIPIQDLFLWVLWSPAKQSR